MIYDEFLSSDDIVSNECCLITLRNVMMMFDGVWRHYWTTNSNVAIGPVLVRAQWKHDKRKKILLYTQKAFKTSRVISHSAAAAAWTLNDRCLKIASWWCDICFFSSHFKTSIFFPLHSRRLNAVERVAMMKNNSRFRLCLWRWIASKECYTWMSKRRI